MTVGARKHVICDTVIDIAQLAVTEIRETLLASHLFLGWFLTDTVFLHVTIYLIFAAAGCKHVLGLQCTGK
jgi:hypothetical protein